MKIKNKIRYFFKELGDEIRGIIGDVKGFMSAYYFVDWYDDKKILSTGYFVVFAGMVAGMYFNYHDMFTLFLQIVGFLIAYNVVRGVYDRRVSSIQNLRNIKSEISQAEFEVDRYNEGIGGGHGIYDIDDANKTLLYYKNYR